MSTTDNAAQPAQEPEMSEVKPWFPREVKPARYGVYEVFWFAYPVFARWTSNGWCRGSVDKEIASTTLEHTDYRPKRWRGLSSDPSKRIKESK